jgi:general stress protein 26
MLIDSVLYFVADDKPLCSEVRKNLTVHFFLSYTSASFHYTSPQDDANWWRSGVKDEPNVEQIEANTEVLLASWVSCYAQAATFGDLELLL